MAASHHHRSQAGTAAVGQIRTRRLAAKPSRRLHAPLFQQAARTREALWTTIGRLLDTFTPAECRSYLANSGYASE